MFIDFAFSMITLVVFSSQYFSQFESSAILLYFQFRRCSLLKRMIANETKQSETTLYTIISTGKPYLQKVGK